LTVDAAAGKGDEGHWREREWLNWGDLVLIRAAMATTATPGGFFSRWQLVDTYGGGRG
jgi:hypothetical protein